MNTKKIWVFLVAVSLMIGMVSSCLAVEVKPGDTVTIQLTLKQNTKKWTVMGFYLYYDNKVFLNERAVAYNGWRYTDFSRQFGVSGSGSPVKTGAIATVTLEIAKDAAPGTYTVELGKVSCSRSSDYQSATYWGDRMEGSGLVIDIRDSVFVVVGNPKGDLTGDGVADGRDLLRLAKFIAGQDVTIDEKAADLNGDGKIDGRDVLRLAKQLAGM